MLALKTIAYVLGAFGIVGTVVPFLNYDDWWIRGFDYPRQQLIVILGVAALCWMISDASLAGYHYPLLVLLILAMFYQAYRILPYTPLWSRDARPAQQTSDEDRHLSLLISNVLQTNREYHRIIELVRQYQPDIFLAVETDQAWVDVLDRELGPVYPHTVPVPLDNLYGMALYSRLPLEDTRVTYRIKDDIPGIDSRVTLDCGQTIQLHFVHPMPPSPTEAYASTGRDAELALVGQEVSQRGGTAIVAGDLNDVAWSHSTRLFQRLSGMVDPRRGRGLYSTFHADHRFARWPLDHVFLTPDLAIVNMERLPHVGSDHFPIFIRVSYEPAKDEGQAEHPEGDDHREAAETIAAGKRGEDQSVC